MNELSSCPHDLHKTSSGWRDTMHNDCKSDWCECLSFQFSHLYRGWPFPAQNYKFGAVLMLDKNLICWIFDDGQVRPEKGTIKKERKKTHAGARWKQPALCGIPFGLNSERYRNNEQKNQLFFFLDFDYRRIVK